MEIPSLGLIGGILDDCVEFLLSPFAPSGLKVENAQALPITEILVNQEASRPPLFVCSQSPELTSRMRSEQAAKAAAGLNGAGAQNQSLGSDRYGAPLSLASLAERDAAWIEAASPALCVATAVLRLAAAAGPSYSEHLLRSVPDGKWSTASRVVITAAAFDSYAPWTAPAIAKSARGLVLALRSCYGDEAPTASGYDLIASDVVALHAAELLRWCRTHSADGAWKQPSHAHVRYVAGWVAGRLPLRSLNATTITSALQTAFRLCDDWQATNAWIGASSVLHIFETVIGKGGDSAQASPTGAHAELIGALMEHRQLIEQALTRAGDCRHPTVIAVAHCASLAWLRIWAGPPPSLHASAGAKAVSGCSDSHAAYLALVGRGAAADSPEVSLTDGPYETALLEVTRSLALSTAPRLQHAHLAFGLAPLLRELGWRASTGAAVSVEPLAPHVAPIIRALVPLVSDSGDARVVAAALACMQLCVSAAPSCFSLPDEAANALLDRALQPSPAAILPPSSVLQGCVPPELAFRADLVDACVSAATQAHSQAAAGLYSCPPPGAENGDLPAKAAANDAWAGKATAWVQAHALALLHSLTRDPGCAPEYVRRSVRALHEETLALLAHAAAAEGSALEGHGAAVTGGPLCARSGLESLLQVSGL